MNKIRIDFPGVAEVYKDSDMLFDGLKTKSSSTRAFTQAVNDFFAKFNETYNANVSLEDILRIYEKKSNIGFRESIILCKALLDFVQSHWVEITFRDKAYVLRFTTLASLNATLEFSPLWADAWEALRTLSVTISSFVQRIRDYFRMILPDHGMALQDIHIDEHFFAIPWIKKEAPIIEVVDDAGEKEPVQVSSGSVKISDSLVIPCNVSNDELIKKFQGFDNRLFITFFDYIYDRIPFWQRGGKKHIDIAKFVFTQYEPSLGQTIERVYTNGSRLRIETLQKIDFAKLKRFLLNDASESIKVSEPPETSNPYVTFTMLRLRPWVVVSLENDEVFIEQVTNLSTESVQVFFGYLEDIVRKKYSITWSPVSKLVSLIQLSEDKGVNISQKITSVRREPSRVYAKFFENNINVTALRQLLLSVAILPKKVVDEMESTWDDEDDIWEVWGEKKSMSFSFQEEGEDVLFDIEIIGTKNLAGFVWDLNTLIAKQCERLEVSGFIEPMSEQDFEGVALNTAFFSVIRRGKAFAKFADIFEIFSQENLEKFLRDWHIQVGKKLKESKVVYVDPGSREELFDFVFNVWQKRLNTIVGKEIRKSGTTRSGHVDRRKRTSTLTEEMFAWITTLTPDFVSQLPASAFQQIFSRTSKKDVEEMLKEYLATRRLK